MPRLSVALSDTMHNRLVSLASQNNDSMSNIANRLIHLGIQSLENTQKKPRQIEQHCYQLVIQMNALVKNLSAEILKFDQTDFDALRNAAVTKYSELTADTN